MSFREQYLRQHRGRDTTLPGRQPTKGVGSKLGWAVRTLGQGRGSLEVGTPGDPYEREADRVADQVMAMPLGNCLTAGAGRQQIGTANLAGGALPVGVRRDFERRFGHAFSSVRIHSDAEASRLSRSFQARAVTYRDDIYFGPGQYQPHTGAGRRLLAHELAHVVQQRGGMSSGPVQLGGTPGGARVQGDFWGAVGRGWDMYTRMTDEGAPFAQKLMRWRMLGVGADYRTREGDEWDSFMAKRPEIQRAMAARFPALVIRFAGRGPTGNEWMGGWQSFTDTVTNVRLNELESMRLTLHGCHRIDISGRYWVGVESGVTTVKLGGVRFTWVDRADLHPGTATELSTGEAVDDREFTAAGWDYDIFIVFAMPSISTWTISGSTATHVRGWPPEMGVPEAGWRG